MEWREHEQCLDSRGTGRNLSIPHGQMSSNHQYALTLMKIIKFFGPRLLLHKPGSAQHNVYTSQSVAHWHHSYQSLNFFWLFLQLFPSIRVLRDFNSGFFIIFFDILAVIPEHCALWPWQLVTIYIDVKMVCVKTLPRLINSDCIISSCSTQQSIWGKGQSRTHAEITLFLDTHFKPLIYSWQQRQFIFWRHTLNTRLEEKKMIYVSRSQLLLTVHPWYVILWEPDKTQISFWLSALVGPSQ